MAKKSSFLSKIKIFLIVAIVLLLLTIGAVAAAIHFEVVSDDQVQWANENLGLYRLPLVGADETFEYFQVPDGVVWPPEPEEDESSEEEKDKTETAVAKKDDKQNVADAKKQKEVKISRKEVEEQMAAREAAEKKRIGKLARIYENMKPEEAAKALDGVELETIVLILQKMNEDNAAQVLAKMEPLMAAQITQMLFEGTQRLAPQPTQQQQQSVPQ